MNNSEMAIYSVRNEVKQGEVISPVLFCVYVDGLLKLLSDAKVGCYIGLNSMALLKELHWLPIRIRIEFKVVTLCYKAYRLGTPSYLASSLQPYLPSRMLRSSNLDQLTVQASRIKLTSRRFSACAPSWWNKLPASLRAAEPVNVFKSHLKTHLSCNCRATAALLLHSGIIAQYKC